MGDRSFILMFHRFSVSTDQHSAAVFRRILRYLRQHRYPILDLEVMIRGVLEGSPLPRRAVAITFDDGYADQFEIALPLLAEFDAPATFFLTTGFTDGGLWMWWDQIEYLMTRTTKKQVELKVGGETSRFDLASDVARLRSTESLTVSCKALVNGQLQSTIRGLAAAAELDLPSGPPPDYLPMTWDQARIAERFGMRFGPATVSHPILSRVDDPDAAYEITHSWHRVQAELSNPTPVFCFPNGKLGDFGPREIDLCARAGLLAAVTAEPGYVQRTTSTVPERPFTLPRFSGPDDLTELVRLSSGLQVLLSSIPR